LLIDPEATFWAGLPLIYRMRAVLYPGL